MTVTGLVPVYTCTMHTGTNFALSLYRALKALWSYLNQKGIDSEAIWEKIKDIVVKTIIA